jgi:hypothetical protein
MRLFGGERRILAPLSSWCGIALTGQRLGGNAERVGGVSFSQQHFNLVIRNALHARQTLIIVAFVVTVLLTAQGAHGKLHRAVALDLRTGLRVLGMIGRGADLNLACAQRGYCWWLTLPG